MEKISSLILVIILVVPTITNVSAQDIKSFSECYSHNAANFVMGEQFTPYSYDLNDPKMKKLISSMCNFYHEKTGIWVDLSQDRDIMKPYDQEFWTEYPINELPKELLESMLGQ